VEPLDNISYVAIVMGLAGAGFFMGGLLCYHSLLPALASSLFGCVLGLISAARVLRQRGLPFSATMGDMRSLREGAKGDGIFVKNPNWKMRGLFCLAVGLSLVASSGYMVIATYVRHIPVASVVWVTLATGIVAMAMGLRVMQRQPSSRLVD
jgi:hypothetical protein